MDEPNSMLNSSGGGDFRSTQNEISLRIKVLKNVRNMKFLNHEKSFDSLETNAHYNTTSIIIP